jgi:hypothetical protein
VFRVLPSGRRWPEGFPFREIVAGVFSHRHQRRRRVLVYVDTGDKDQNGTFSPSSAGCDANTIGAPLFR